MVDMIYINLYRSQSAPAPSLRASSSRKVYTSFLLVLFFLTISFVAYFVILETFPEPTIAVKEMAVIEETQETKPKSTEEIVAELKVQWASFFEAILDFSPEKIVSNGDRSVLMTFITKKSTQAESLKQALNSANIVSHIIDTSTTKKGFQFILKSKFPSDTNVIHVKSVKNIERTLVINKIDSIALSIDLKLPKLRDMISIDKIDNSEVLLYKLYATGSLESVADLIFEIEDMNEAVTPKKILLTRSEKNYDLQLILGLYRFFKALDTTSIASSK